MRYVFIAFILFLLVSCIREKPVVSETNNIDIEALPNPDEFKNTNEVQIVYLPTVTSGNKFCTEYDIKKIFKNSKAVEKENINFADGKLRYINFYKLMAFTKKFEDYKKLNGMGVWRQKFDCDDFAQMFMIFLKIEFLSYDIQDEAKKANEVIQGENEDSEAFFDRLIGSVMNPPNDPEGLAVGEVWFYQKVEGSQYPNNHAINIVFLGPDNFLFIEPQNCTILHLSEEEINSIYFIRF